MSAPDDSLQAIKLDTLGLGAVELTKRLVEGSRVIICFVTIGTGFDPVKLNRKTKAAWITGMVNT